MDFHQVNTKKMHVHLLHNVLHMQDHMPNMHMVIAEELLSGILL